MSSTRKVLTALGIKKVAVFYGLPMKDIAVFARVMLSVSKQADVAPHIAAAQVGNALQAVREQKAGEAS